MALFIRQLPQQARNIPVEILSDFGKGKFGSKWLKS